MASVAGLFERAALPYAVIGAHAVNAWIEPRLTADIDITARISADSYARLERIFADAGFELARAEGMAQPSGPDFVRFVSSDGIVVVEVQAAKTQFQRVVIERGIAAEDGVRVATPDDLIVLKLIADRPKDQADLLALVALPGIDWDHVERWAAEWEVLDRLRELRRA